MGLQGGKTGLLASISALRYHYGYSLALKAPKMILPDDLEDRKALVMRLLARWIPLIGLEIWDIHVKWAERADRASCDCKPHHQEAVISFNQRWLRRVDRYQELLFVVVHELCHLRTWNMAENSKFTGKALKYLDEEQTSLYARSLIRAFEAGSKHALDSQTA